MEKVRPSNALSEAATPALASTRFLGRQPIVDAKLNIFGYELLFREGRTNSFSGDPERATRQVIDNYLLFIPETDRANAFVNCTREALVSDLVTLLPVTRAVLEILETLEPDPQLLDSCRSLKERGYRFALDDFAPHVSKHPFLEFADYIKIDFKASGPGERAEIYRLARSCKAKLIAEKIETREEMKIAQSEGCQLFQGYFFSKPTIIAQQTIPQNRITYVLLMVALSREMPDLKHVESLFKTDASLCYRLLRMANSLIYYAPSPIVSIPTALLMLGQAELRKLVTVAMAGSYAASKGEALIRVALERAKFCELFAPWLRQEPSKMYLLGMLSLIDTILEVPMAKVVEAIPIDDEMKGALLGKETRIGTALELVRCFESSDWTSCEESLKRVQINEVRLAELYREAVAWAAETGVV
jgi:EAL and modified HD-GYP domain-containing signal transduction protein